MKDKETIENTDFFVNSKEMTEALISNTPGGFVVFIVQDEQFHPVYQSAGLGKMLGYEEEDGFPELFRYNINYFVHPEDMEAVVAREKFSIEHHENFAMEYRAICKDCSEKWLYTSSHIVRKKEYDIHYASYVDFTDRKEAELKFQEKTNKDLLTHLWNKKAGLSQMNKVILENPCHKHAVLFMDLDNFKKMNDSEGHEIGNHILVCFAKVLTGLLGKQIVVRYGGDEFVALIENITSRMSLEEKIEQIHKEFKEKVEEMNYSATCSIGVAYTSQKKEVSEEADIEGVINHAEEAMYDAKKGGKNSYVFYKYDEDDEEALKQALYLYDNIACSKQIERISNGHMNQIGVISIRVENLDATELPAENTTVLVERMLNNLFRKADLFQTDESEFLILAVNISQKRFSEKFYDLEHYFKNSKYNGISLGASWCSGGESIKKYIDFAVKQREAYEKNSQEVTIKVTNLQPDIVLNKKIFIFNRDMKLKEELMQSLQEDYELTFEESIETIEKDTREYDLFLLAAKGEESVEENYFQFSNKFDLDEIPVIVMVDSITDKQKESCLRHGVNEVIERPFNFKLIKYMIDNLIKLSPYQRRVHSPSFDELTFLPNASYFYEVCSRIMREHSNENYSLISFDVEKFKTFNDANGFDAGNQFIVEIAEIISEEFNGAVIARMGDDHFAAFSAKAENSEAIRQVYERVYHNSFGFPMNMKAGIYHLRKEDTVKLAYDRAKLTCDNVKNEYDVIYGVYDDALRDRLFMEKYINDNLNKAIIYEYLQVYYQPVIRTASQKICGFESLIRWNDPKMGFLSPAAFIPTLEKNRIISRLDIFVIKQVCKDIRKFYKVYGMPIPVSINLSQLDFELCDIYKELMDATEMYDIPHNMIHIEITESAMNSQNDKMIATIERFRQDGFEIWIDDFGSEYSSLNSLKNFKLDVLKLDMKFLENFENNENAKKIVSAVVDMAKEIGCRTVSEGVEHENEFHFLKEIGCDKIQGYYFYKPMPYDKASCLTNFETLEEKIYYDELGKINYQSNTLLSEKDESMFATLNAPLAIYEIENDKFRILFSSQGYYETVGTLNLYTIEDIEAVVNDESTALYQTLRGPVYRTLASGNFEKVDFLFGRTPCRIVCKRIAKMDKKGAFYVLLYNTEYMNNLQKNEAVNSYMSFLCSIYDRIDFIDYENNKIKNVYLNSQYLSNLFEGTTVEEGIVGFAKNNIVEQDREGFLKFYDKDNVLNNLLDRKNHYIGDIFRVIDLNGEIKWQLFMVVKIVENDSVNYLSCVRDFNTVKSEKITSYNDKYVMEILDFINDGAAIFKYQEGKGYMQFANQALLSMLKAKEQDIVGCNYEQLAENIHPDDRKLFVDMLEELDKKGKCQAVYRFCDFETHEPVWLMANGKKRGIGEDEMAYITFSNVSHQQDMIEREQKFSHCLQLITAQRRFEENSDEILESIREYYEADRAYVFEIDWKKNHMSNTFECVKPGITEEKENLQKLPISMIIYWLSKFNQGQSVFIDDLETIKDDPSRRPEYETLVVQDIQSLMVAPIVYEHHLYGYLGVDNPRKHRADKEYIINLTLFISQSFYDRKMREELYHLSYYDSLTSLKNRNSYNLLWEQAKREDDGMKDTGVAFVDINGLKRVNDEEGHYEGDQLIKKNAEIMKVHIDEEMLYRISGDEFVIVLKNIAEDEFVSRMEALKEDLKLHDNIASLGYVWKHKIVNLEEVFKAAEEKMYKSKNLYYMSDPAHDRRRKK